MSTHDLDRLLLRLVTGSKDEIPGMLSGVDDSTLQAVFARSRMHKATMLLSAKLWRNPQIPAAARQTATGVVAGTLVADQHLAEALSVLAPAFEQSHLPVLAFKGPILCRALDLPYPSKPSGDLDLLVRPEDLQNAHSVLTGLGYVRGLVDTFEADYTSDGISVDLHWSLLTMGGWGDSLAGLFEDAWRDRIHVDIEGVSVPTLSPTHTLLHLIIHEGCHHVCTDWASLYNIARCTIVRQDSIDWDLLIRLADSAGIRYTIWPPLRLSREHFGAVVPPDVIERLRLPWYRMPLHQISRAGFEGRLSDRSHRRAAMGWNLFAQPGIIRTVSWAVARIRHGLSKPAQATD